MIVNTHISYGHLRLINLFFKANELEVAVDEPLDNTDNFRAVEHMVLRYEDDSDTALKITFMSMRHLGFENMLCDYLIKCGVDKSSISAGFSTDVKRNMKQLDKDWEEHRKSLGFR